MEHGRIGPDRELDSDRRFIRGCLIVRLQSSADFARLHTNNRVISRGISWRPQKDFGSDCPFFEQLRMALKLMLDYIFEKLLAAGGAPEERACEDFVQLLMDDLPALVTAVQREVRGGRIIR
jgi:hypothetical protein